MNISSAARILRTAPALRPIATLVEQGEVSVQTRDLEEGIHALYVPTPGTFAEEPALNDGILLTSKREWNFDGNVYDRSILVHEGYHALDDLQLAQTGTTYLESEKRAWSGQAAYLVQELTETESPKEALQGLVQEMKSRGLGGMEALGFGLGIRLAPLPPEHAAVGRLFEDAMVAEARDGMTGLDELFEDPGKSLTGLLTLIYMTSPDTRLELDGI